MRGQRSKNALFIFLVFAFSLLLRAAFAFLPPRSIVYEPQELSVIFAAAGFFAGLPAAATTLWSIGSIGLPLVVLFGFDFIFRNHGSLFAFLSHDPSGIIAAVSAYLARIYLDPGQQLMTGRVFVSLISAIAPAALFGFFRRQGMNCAAVVSAVIFSTSPFLVLQGAMVMTDALGFSFFTLFLIRLLECRQQKKGKDFVLMGIFYGAAVAGKFPYLAFLPAALAGIYGLNPRQGMRAARDLGIFFFSLCATLLLLIPFVWLDPLTLLKNIAGNLSMDYLSTAASGHAFYWAYLARDCGTLFMGWEGWLLLVPAGAAASFFILGRRPAAVMAFGCALFLFPLGFSRIAYTRYCMPLFLFTGMYAALCLELIFRDTVRMRGRLFVFFAVSLIAGINLMAVAADFKRTHSSDNLTDCIAWVNARVSPSFSIAVPGQLSNYFTPDTFTVRQRRDIYRERYRHLDERIGVYFSLNRMRLAAGSKDSPLIPAVFGSVEKQKIFQYELLLWYYAAFGQPSPVFKVMLYDKTGSDAVTMPFSRALDLFASRKLDLLVSAGLIGLKGREPFKVFDSFRGPAYYVYVNQGVK